MISRRRGLLLLPAVGLFPALFARAAATGYPTRPVTILVTTAAGGPLDEAARRLGQYFSTTWNVPVVVDNRGGAGGTIATSALVRAPADGYTLMLSTRGIVINPSLYSNLSFDTANDVLPVAKLNEQATILVVANHVQARTFGELMTTIRQQPGKLTFGSAGSGGIPHIAGELFMKATGTQLTHVPFKGLAPVLIEMQAGRVDLLFASPQTVASFLGDGRLRVFAIASPGRSPVFPDLPTFDELGVKGMNISSWYGLFAPAKTPTDVVDRINAGVLAFQKTPQAQKWMKDERSQPTPLSSAEFATDFRRDLVSMSLLLKDLGLKP